MKWKKRGLVYAPTGELWWARNYATIPTVEVVDDSVLRVYFASLDENRFGRIGYVDVSAGNPRQILYETKEPILDLGELGTFDDSGVNPSCLLNVAGKKYLYYIGWQRCERVPYMLFAGLAISDDGTTFKRAARVPILDRTDDEPFSRSAPFVLLEEGIFRMWYWTCLRWTREHDWIHYNNVLKCARSEDGMHWVSQSQPCIAPDWSQDYSIGRPWVIREAGIYRMWYSIRSSSKVKPYRIGYAESRDGLNWRRKDDEVGMQSFQQGLGLGDDLLSLRRGCEGQAVYVLQREPSRFHRLRLCRFRVLNRTMDIEVYADPQKAVWDQFVREQERHLLVSA